MTAIPDAASSKATVELGFCCKDGPVVDWSLYTAPADEITAELLKAFIDDQREERLLTESMTLELKARRRGDNVAKAVAGFANAEGGIVLVGLSEEEPSFETALGVSPSEVVAIGDSCRNLLSPLVQPTIVPVPLPSRDTVIIVVRVDFEPELLPVCKAGQVFVRAPGQTVAAAREQIVSLVTRSQRAPSGAVVTPSLHSAFYPQYDQGDDETRDALIRVAGGVWLRPSVSDLVFGTATRSNLRIMLEASPFFLYPALGRVQWRRPEQRPKCTEHSFTATTAKFMVDYPVDDATYRVSAQFRRDGSRIAYALDLELRVRQGERSGPEPRLGREELATALVVGVETAALLVPNHIATAARTAPQRLDPICAWVQNSTLRFDQLLDLSRTHRASENSFGSLWGWERPAPRDLHEITAAVQGEFDRLYLNLGLADAEGVAEADLARALTEREHIRNEVVTIPLSSQ